MTDKALKALEVRLASLPTGPWWWARDYQLDHGTHWCLTNESAMPKDTTFDHYSVTMTTQAVANTEKGQARVCDTPVMAFLADSRAIVDALLAEVKQWREVFSKDCLVDSPALQAAHRAGEEAMRERIVKEASRLRPVVENEWVLNLIRAGEVQDP